jgi:hypothetical protein
VAKHLFSSGWLGLWIYANLRMSNSIAQMNDFGLARETLQSCGIVVTDVILQNSWLLMLLYHKAMLSYTSATIATALRRCPFFQPLLNALVLLHAADNRLQRSSHIAWRIPRFELSPTSLQLGARFVGIRNVLIIGVLKGHIFLHGCTVCLFRIMGSSSPGITKMMLTIS